AVVSFITAFVCCFGSETSAACIDYGDYVRWVGGVDTRGDAIGVAVSDPYAYVADYASGLQVIPPLTMAG
ncbi:MAG TPA: hypothetical protein VFR10_00335, partial [bacterium]|nr:hypothetical protein [bacterium]